MITRLFLLIAAGFIWLSPHAAAQDDASSVSARSLVERLMHAYDALEDYSVDVSAVIDMPGVHVPPMEARIYYKRPGKLTFRSEKFFMLPKHGVAFDPSLVPVDTLPEAAFAFVGEDTLAGEPVRIVRVNLRGGAAARGALKLFIDPETPLLLKVTRSGAQSGAAGVTGDVTLSYASVNGFFLPSEVVVQMQVPGRLLRKFRLDDPIPTVQDSAEEEESADTGSIRVTYSNYLVNHGIDDAVFDSPFDR